MDLAVPSLLELALALGLAGWAHWLGQARGGWWQMGIWLPLLGIAVLAVASFVVATIVDPVFGGIGTASEAERIASSIRIGAGALVISNLLFSISLLASMAGTWWTLGERDGALHGS